MPSMPEIEQDELSAGTKGLVDGSHGLLGILEMMVGVADEGQIDGVWRQFTGCRSADYASYVFQPRFLGSLLDVLDEFPGDVHSIDPSLGTDLDGKQAGEKARAGTDVGNYHAGLEFAGGHDLLSLPENLPALAVSDLVCDVRIFILLVDTREDAFLLGMSRAVAEGKKGKQQSGKVPGGASGGVHHGSSRGLGLSFRFAWVGPRSGSAVRLAPLQPDYFLIVISPIAG